MKREGETLPTAPTPRSQDMLWKLEGAGDIICYSVGRALSNHSIYKNEELVITS